MICSSKRYLAPISICVYTNSWLTQQGNELKKRIGVECMDIEELVAAAGGDSDGSRPASLTCKRKDGRRRPTMASGAALTTTLLRCSLQNLRCGAYPQTWYLSKERESNPTTARRQQAALRGTSVRGKLKFDEVRRGLFLETRCLPPKWDFHHNFSEQTPNTPTLVSFSNFIPNNNQHVSHAFQKPA